MKKNANKRFFFFNKISRRNSKIKRDRGRITQRKSSPLPTKIKKKFGGTLLSRKTNKLTLRHYPRVPSRFHTSTSTITMITTSKDFYKRERPATDPSFPFFASSQSASKLSLHTNKRQTVSMMLARFDATLPIWKRPTFHTLTIHQTQPPFLRSLFLSRPQPTFQCYFVALPCLRSSRAKINRRVSCLMSQCV